MNEWLIRLVIALIAASFGAIVRPWIDEWLVDRRRIRSEERERADEWISILVSRTQIAVRAVVAMQKGHPAQVAASASHELSKEWVRSLPSPKFPWAPDRIHDDRLRELLSSAMDEVNRMMQETREVAGGREPEHYAELLRGSADRVEALRSSIDRRVRELKL